MPNVEVWRYDSPSGQAITPNDRGIVPDAVYAWREYGTARIYYESRHMLGGLAPTPFPRPEGRVSVPTGCGSFPLQYDRRDLPVDTTSAEARKVADARYNVVHFTTMPHGGHFPAFEQPKLWLDDIRAFFATVRTNQR